MVEEDEENISDDGDVEEDGEVEMGAAMARKLASGHGCLADNADRTIYKCARCDKSYVTTCGRNNHKMVCMGQVLKEGKFTCVQCS